MGARNTDAMIRQNSGDFRDHAGPVGDVETDVVGGRGFSDGKDAATFPIGQETAVTAGLPQSAGCFDKVGDHGGRRGILTGTTAVKKGFAGGIAMDGDGVEDAMDGGEDVGFRDERWLDAEFNRAVGVFTDDG